VVTCEHGNGLSDSTKGGEFIYQLNNYQFVRKTSLHGVSL
jgi:hypothetical protein